jgi:predicted dehydrogenase
VKVAELLESGVIGRLVAIDAIEQVGYFHQAQAYVRGYWRKAENSTPMILAKCSHDLDLLQFYANSTCESLSSVGDLTYFTSENAPAGATERCLDCPHQNTCPFSAKTQYLDNWLRDRTDTYPYNVPCHAPITEEKMRAALQNTMYGKCVFLCDNDVVDHQITQMTFQNGVKATLTMTAFTRHCGRRMEFFGTNGQITLDEVRDYIRVGVFGEPEYELKISDLLPPATLHGGGDHGIVHTLYDMLTGKTMEKTALVHSAESHLMGIAAEESRKSGGALVYVHEK